MQRVRRQERLGEPAARIANGSICAPSWSTGAGWVLGSFTPTSPPWFDGNNRLVNALLGIQYDAAGNLTAIGGFTFAYDAENRLVSSTLNSVTTTYAYDGEGRRVKKGSVVMVYDAFGRLAAESGGTAEPVGTEYLTADHLGSTRLVTSSTGAERRCLDYLPFGEQMTQGMGTRGACYASATEPRVKFTGKERDAESGLDYFVARYYSAAQGRFTSPDEFHGGIVDPFTGQQVGAPGPLPYADITDPQTLNKYAYVRNNPLRYVDPDGHCPWCFGALVGAGVGVGAQLIADIATGQEITVRKTVAAAVGGAIVGGTAGAASELGLAVQVAIVGDAGVVGGIAERAIKTGSMNEAMKNPGDIVTDFATNAGGHAVNKAAEAVVKTVAGGAIEELSRQAARAQTTNRQQKIESRLADAQQRLEQKQRVASTTTDSARETLVRRRQQEPPCKGGESGCGT
ncbi:MAG: RHS repeat domain-containing protein [Acidobacteriota bacterium]